ncbi:nucleotidyltransferase [Candidatus Methylomirabilis lanthanidiphila]|uniref:Nucleotidyltransferase n=1 Tax=Candidatus Methylomirabilis lanthanidiphila TaxID=2211376 RepID=A0A564ZJ17_9BACT|nr:phosphocholine cytidylyltransferase family protein [Candidatus Methylomirabilis lanthanidiphila]VUZ85315.1 nucleotidyltransferase [Candidatus Methylomirabilis lanthanidiphila]
MRGIILSAGQGKRLLPLTAEVPKCVLQVGGQTLVERQIAYLMKCGIDQVTVVVGFGAEKVEQVVRTHFHPDQATTLYNPFFSVSDNLVSCWLVRHLMTEDFVLLNGDTLFEPAILQCLLDAPPGPITLVVDRKPAYDADDMKVMVEGRRLLRVGKTLSPEQSHGESIGMTLFRGNGPGLFSEAIERALRKPDALRNWYLSVIDEMAQAGLVRTCPIQGLQWTEVDCLADLEQAQQLTAL